MMSGSSSGPTADLHFQAAACDACGGLFPRSTLDEDGWCDECQPRMQRRMRIGRHAIALAIVVPFAIWILRLERADYLPWTAWLLPLAAAYYLGFRIGREVVKGYTRWHRAR